MAEVTQIKYNLIDSSKSKPAEVRPGHALFLTDGGVRLCHYRIVRPSELGLDLRIEMVAQPAPPGIHVVAVTELGPGWGELLDLTLADHPDRVRTGVEPDARCPFAGEPYLREEQ